MTALKKSLNQLDRWVLIPIIISMFTASMDLLLTRYILALSSTYYETRILGNQPGIYYPWMFMLIIVLYAIEKEFDKMHIYSIGFALIPLIAVLWNLQFLM